MDNTVLFLFDLIQVISLLIILISSLTVLLNKVPALTQATKKAVQAVWKLFAWLLKSN